MREITFRVWCEFELDGELHKSMESPASWFMLTQTGKLWTYDPGEIPRPLEKNYKKAIPLFYTGLKDKNGKEIYEGDVVKNQSGTPFIVRWETMAGKWSRQHIGSGVQTEGSLREIQHLPLWIEHEIIGNIHENPELLEEKT
ncbi:MAG: YopX family protein [Candidatus Bathyarchaeia archaeon]